MESELKLCKKCGKPRTIFRKCKTKNGKEYIRSECRDCRNEYKRENFKKNYQDPEKRKKHLEKSKLNEAKDKNKQRRRQKRLENKEIINARLRGWKKNKRQTDITFYLRNLMSHHVANGLRRNNSSKNGVSSFKHLEYTVGELKQHLESLFEPWMNWNNHGHYKADEWDDNDPTTWKWQIDHIIPHSTFPYTSMEDENFKKCWSLENLRPLSAKQNQSDGASKIRHKINT